MLTTDRHEASRGLFATAELLVIGGGGGGGGGGATSLSAAALSAELKH